MIDLIIPVYKNLKGLKRTLESVNYKVFKVTVIEDGSNEVTGIQRSTDIFRLKKNIGPGQARQYGIDNTSNPYIMFIDAGDIFISKEVQYEIEDTVAANPYVNVFAWLYYYKNKLTDHLDNRLHSKIYKRQFLEKYDITFSRAGSYMNEDVGFNRTCRIISNSICQPIFYIDKPIIKWVTDENSLTQKNNRQVLYEKQTEALSINSIHCISCCRKNNIEESLIQAEINEIAMALYYWFIRTAAERPEFLPQAWRGAKIFYDRFSKNIDPNELIIGSTRMKKCMLYRNEIGFPINILRFKRDMENFKNLPSNYLTKV